MLKLILSLILLLHPLFLFAEEKAGFTWANDFPIPGGLDRWLSNEFSLFYEKDLTRYTVYNAMYTPDNLKGSPVPTHDRPWDGISLLTIRNQSAVTTSERRYFSYSLGAAGRASGSAELQRWVHSQGFGARPTYQPINNSEPLFNFGYLHEKDAVLDTLLGISKSTSAYGFDIGNYVTQAVLIETVRKGFNNFYVIGEMKGQAVLYNTTLDGRLFSHNEYTVDRVPFVARFSAGVGTEIRSCTFTFMVRYLTEEYDGQRGRHTYADMGLTCKR